MAATVVSRDLEGVVAAPAGNRRVTVALVTFDNSYPTGGEVVTAAALGLNQIDILLANSATVATTLLTVPAKQADGSYKIRLSTAATGAEVANASDQSLVSVEVLAIGR